MMYYFLGLLSKFFCLFPYRGILFVGRGAGFLYYKLAKRQVDRSHVTIMKHLKVSEQEADAITRRMCSNLGMTFMEVLYTPVLSSVNIDDFVKLERKAYVFETLAENKGIILLTIHLDNWEWGGVGMALHGYPMTSFVKRQPSASVNKFMQELRAKAGIELFERGTGETITAAKTLKRGKMLGFIADQDGGKNGIFMPFLGKMASTPVGPAFFAKRFGAPILPLFIVRDENGGHKIVVYDKFYYEDTGDEVADMYKCTEQMTRIVEEVVKKYPDNWLWFQKRWNTPYNERRAE